MKIDRAEVARLVGIADNAKLDDAAVRIDPGKLAALCRLALEVMDAPVGRLEGRDCLWFSQRDITHLLGEPVRLVRVPDGDACIGGGEE